MVARISRIALITSLSAFVAVILVDPGDRMLHLKLPLLIISLSIWAFRVAFGLVDPGGHILWALVLLFALILPGLASITSLLSNTLPVGDPRFQLMKECTVILILLPLASENIDLTKYIVRWGLLIAVMTLALAVLNFTMPLAFIAVRDYLLEKDNAFIGPRNLVGMGIGSFYYKSVGVLVFPAAYYLTDILDRPKKSLSILLFMVVIAAILCTDSRAAVLGVSIVISSLVFRKLQTTIGPEAALSILLVTMVLSIGYFAKYLQSGESSNAAKIGHIRSYAVEYDTHPIYLLSGQGADTVFNSQGFQAKTTITELTYLDMIRWFGIPEAAVIIIAFIYPVFKLSLENGGTFYLALAYAVYLIEAATDPLLICSMGLMVVSSIWGVALMNKHSRSTSEPVSH